MFQSCRLRGITPSQDSLVRGLGDHAALRFGALALCGGIILPCYIFAVGESDPIPARANVKSQWYSWQILGLSFVMVFVSQVLQTPLHALHLAICSWAPQASR